VTLDSRELDIVTLDDLEKGRARAGGDCAT